MSNHVYIVINRKWKSIFWIFNSKNHFFFTVGRIVSDHKSRKKEEKSHSILNWNVYFCWVFFSRALKSKAIARYGKWEDQIRLSLAITKHRNKTYCIIIIFKTILSMLNATKWFYCNEGKTKRTLTVLKNFLHDPIT